LARPQLWLVRHGETEWSRGGRHTSHSDVLLTSAGAEASRRLGAALAGVTFDLVLTSPRRRASDTAALMGFPEAIRDPSAVEWDYGEYEGQTTAAIRELVPTWTVWTHPSPGGETADEVAARADRVIERVLAEASERALVVSHGHFLRVLGARWVEEPPDFGARLPLGTATISVLGWERETRGIQRWNLGVTLAGEQHAPEGGTRSGDPGPRS
jgi:broad specificity phosphatase PhoE